MTDPTIWWILAGCAVGVEMLTGTFYLLMLAIGLATGAVAAHMGATQVVQIVAAALVGSSAVLGCYWRQKGQRPDAQANPNVNLDIGETLLITTWNPDGTAQVHYRGAQWTAIHRAGISPSAGTHRIAEVIGNRLLVDRT